MRGAVVMPDGRLLLLLCDIPGYERVYVMHPDLGHAVTLQHPDGRLTTICCARDSAGITSIQGTTHRLPN